MRENACRSISLWAFLSVFLPISGWGNVDGDAMKIEIALDKEKFIVGDDVRIKVRITNISKEGIDIQWAEGMSQIQFVVVENDEETAHLYSYGYSTNSFMIVPRKVMLLDRPATRKLKSGEAIERHLSVVGDSPFRALSPDKIDLEENYYPALFPRDTLRKGKYRLKAIFSEDRYQALGHASKKYRLKARIDPDDVWAGRSTKRDQEMPVFESNEITFAVAERAGKKGESTSSDVTGVDGRQYEVFLWKEPGHGEKLFYQRCYPDPVASNIYSDPWKDAYIPFTHLSDIKVGCRFLKADSGKRFTGMLEEEPSQKKGDLVPLVPCWIVWQDGEEVKCAMVQRKVIGQWPLGSARETIDIVVNDDRSLTVLVREKDQFACHVVRGWSDATQTAAEMKKERVAIAVDPQKIADPSLKAEEGQVFFMYTEGGKPAKIPIGAKVKTSEDQESQDRQE